LREEGRRTEFDRLCVRWSSPGRPRGWCAAAGPR